MDDENGFGPVSMALSPLNLKVINLHEQQRSSLKFLSAIGGSADKLIWME